MLTTKFDPGVYAGLSPEVRLYALGLMSQEPIRSFGELGAALGRDCANVTPLEENPALDTEAATRAKVEKAPFSAQKVGREALKLWIPPLADSLAKSTPLGASNRSFMGSIISSSRSCRCARLPIESISAGTGTRIAAGGGARTLTCCSGWSWVERFGTSLNLAVS
jgi:hypothetical protein